MMDKNELSGVIAHELSHIGNRDTLLQTVVVVLVGFIAIIAYVFTRSMMVRCAAAIGAEIVEKVAVS
jgi:heat shock protein HtpX